MRHFFLSFELHFFYINITIGSRKPQPGFAICFHFTRVTSLIFISPVVNGKSYRFYASKEVKAPGNGDSPLI